MNRINRSLALAASMALVLAGCGQSDVSSTSSDGDDSNTSEPNDVEVVTHNDVGGGSDVFTRQIIKFMYEDDAI